MSLAILSDRRFRKLQMLDDAMTDQDLRVPPSNHFEKLRGKLKEVSFDPRQQTVAACVPAGWQPR